MLEPGPGAPGSILARMPEASRVARRNTWPLVIGQSVSQLGDYLALFFALPIFVRDATGSAAQLGLLVMFETVAVLAFGFIAGVLIDRIRVRRALVAADLVRGTAFALLAVAVAVDAGTVWMAFGVAFLVGSMATVFDAGLESYVPSVLTDELLVVGNSRLQVGRNIAQTLGFVAGGFVLAWAGGVAGAFAFRAVAYLVSVTGILLLREIRPRPSMRPEPVWPSLVTGIRSLWGSPPLRWATVSAFAINLAFAPLAAVMTLYAQQDLGVDSDIALGLFFAGFSAIGAGGVALAPRLIRAVGLGRGVIIGAGLFGLGATVAGTTIGVVTVFPFGLAMAGVSINQVAFVTLRQRLTSPDRLGRVVAASRTISFAGIPLGAALGGVLGDAIGLRPLFVGGGLLIAATAALLVGGPLWTVRADSATFDLGTVDALRPDVVAREPARSSASPEGGMPTTRDPWEPEA
jgi:predicted MFS family arabinose efflux permease